jgi:hypothetical protein
VSGFGALAASTERARFAVAYSREGANMATEVRSPISTGYVSRRADSGHLLRHVGKGAMTNPKLMRRDEPVPPSSPVQGQPPGVIDNRRR